MTIDFATSNLSKIKTKFRTSGTVSQPRRKAGSSLNDLGVTDAKVVRCVTQEEYLIRLQLAYHKTTDIKLKNFLEFEIKKILIQRNKL
jgi:hypothetical protein